VASYGPDLPAVHGIAELREFYARALAKVTSSSHHISNAEIDFLDADTATLRCHLYSWQRFADHPSRPDRHRWARYEDTWVRTPAGWAQRSLVYRVAGETGTSDEARVAEHLGSSATR
jgi:SnoaL-like domain